MHWGKKLGNNQDQRQVWSCQGGSGQGLSHLSPSTTSSAQSEIKHLHHTGLSPRRPQLCPQATSSPSGLPHLLQLAPLPKLLTRTLGSSGSKICPDCQALRVPVQTQPHPSSWKGSLQSPLLKQISSYPTALRCLADKQAEGKVIRFYSWCLN